MDADGAGAAEGKRKEIYAYKAPWPIYGMNWSHKVPGPSCVFGGGWACVCVCGVRCLVVVGVRVCVS
jgi:hypothetical protein